MNPSAIRSQAQKPISSQNRFKANQLASLDVSPLRSLNKVPPSYPAKPVITSLQRDQSNESLDKFENQGSMISSFRQNPLNSYNLSINQNQNSFGSQKKSLIPRGVTVVSMSSEKKEAYKFDGSSREQSVYINQSQSSLKKNPYSNLLSQSQIKESDQKNIMSDFQNSIIQIASKVNQMNLSLSPDKNVHNQKLNSNESSIVRKGNLQKIPPSLQNSLQKSKFRVVNNKSPMVISRNELTPLRLPKIKEINSSIQDKSTLVPQISSSLELLKRQNESQSRVDTRVDNKNSSDVQNQAQDSLQKKKAILRKIRYKQDKFCMPNNPTQCRCKIHIQQDQDLRSYINNSDAMREGSALQISELNSQYLKINKPPNNFEERFRRINEDKESVESDITYMKESNYGSPSRNSKDKFSRSSLRTDIKELVKRQKAQAQMGDHITRSQEGLRHQLKELNKESIISDKSILYRNRKSLIGTIIGNQPPLSNRLQTISEGQAQSSIIPGTSSTQNHLFNPTKTIDLDQYLYQSNSETDLGYTQENFSHTKRELEKWNNKAVLKNEKSIEKFYENFRQIQKIQQIESILPENEEIQIKKDPLIEYLKEVSKSNQMPHLLAFKKSNLSKDDYSYKLDSFHINSHFSKAFAENLKFNQKLISLTLSRNNLNDQTLISIIEALPLKLSKLQISYNNLLGTASYQKISSYLLADQKRCISYLNLEGNEMGDEGCKEICLGILQSLHLRTLNLSKNNITDIGGLYLSEVLSSEGVFIVSLLIHWNQIRSKGAIALARALKENETLQIFDASFNSYGSGPFKKVKVQQKKATEKQGQKSSLAKRKEENKLVLPQFEKYTVVANKFKKAFQNNKKLVHVDLSFNSFKESDIQIIGEGLKQNHTIMGIHMMGNEARVDELGFIDPEKTQDHVVSHVFTRIPYNLKTSNVPSKNHLQLKVSSNCWICEGWQQLEFRLPCNDPLHPPPNIHLSFENYKPIKMGLDPLKPLGSEEYLATRMVPPGQLSYFFTTHDSKTTFIDQKAPILFNSSKISIKVMPKEKDNGNNQTSSIDQIQQEIQLVVPKINYIENIQSLQKLLTNEDLLNIKAIPRPEAEIVEQLARPKSPWSLPKSIFASYKIDTDEYLANCFEFDWNCSKIDRLLRQCKDKQRVYNYLKANYRAIREIYKYNSAVGPSGNIFSIGTNVFSDIIYNCTGLLDPKNVKLSDVDLEFISTKAGNQFRVRMNPDRQLIRFQFLEIFVRLGIVKYFKSQICETIEDSIIKMFDEHLLPYFRRFNSSDFRWNKYWNENCDIVLKKNLKTLKEIYTKYSGKETQPGEQKFMAMSEFIDLVTRSGVIDDNFGAREIGVIYNLSMMTQIDEINKERHIQMQFIEFLEALSRVADRVMVKSVSESKVGLQLEKEISIAQRKQSQYDFEKSIIAIEELKQSFQYGGGDSTNRRGGVTGRGDLERSGTLNRSALLALDYLLENQIQDYIHRLALNCMGQEYGFAYKRRLDRLDVLQKQKSKLDAVSNKFNSNQKSLEEDNIDENLLSVKNTGKFQKRETRLSKILNQMSFPRISEVGRNGSLDLQDRSGRINESREGKSSLFTSNVTTPIQSRMGNNQSRMNYRQVGSSLL